MAELLVFAFNQGEDQELSDTDESNEEPELSHTGVNGDGHEMSVKDPKHVVTVEAGPDPDTDSTLPQAIVLDLSPVNFLDTVGVKTLRNVRPNLYSLTNE